MGLEQAAGSAKWANCRPTGYLDLKVYFKYPFPTVPTVSPLYWPQQHSASAQKTVTAVPISQLTPQSRLHTQTYSSSSSPASLLGNQLMKDLAHSFDLLLQVTTCPLFCCKRLRQSIKPLKSNRKQYKCETSLFSV